MPGTGQPLVGSRTGSADADGVRIHYYEDGPADGPVVLFVHGFPELAYSWRHQVPAVAAAGYRAIAIDVRGYGRSGKPARIDEYRTVRHVADNVRLLEHLGAEHAVIVGHDWGAPTAWTSCLLRPDLFDALALLSVPYAPPSVRRPTDAFEEMTGPDNEFYMNYFQEPGRVEAEAEEDVRRWLEGFYWGASGEGSSSSGTRLAVIPKGTRMVDQLPRMESDLPWLPADELDVYIREFERTGLTGGLNRYRNLVRDWEDLAAFRGAPIRVPALFVGGQFDGPTAWGAAAIGRFETTLPDLRGSHILEGSGHWIQQERAEEVNRLLLGFLVEVRPV